MEYNFEGIKFQIVRNEKAHYASILKLYHETSGYQKNIDFVEKKYDTSIYNRKNIGFLAFEGDHVASYYGVFPIKMIYKEVEYLAAQSGDTLTHPHYQKKGLFTHLAKECYQLAQKESIQFVFGFPNKNSLPGFQKKLNWICEHKIKEFSITVNTLPMAELVSKKQFFSKLYTSWVNNRLKKYLVKPSNIALDGFNTQTNKLRVKKDVDFFNYKKYSNASLILKNDYLIYLKVETHLIVGDVAYFDIEKLPQFLVTLKQLARMLLVYKIKFYLSSNHWLFGYLKNHFQPIDNNYIGFCFFDQNNTISIDDALFSAADFDTF
jgi:GNAT superfamily N-acetyltransferase